MEVEVVFMVENRYQIKANIKSKMYNGVIPSVTANDHIIFEVTLFDDALPMTLNSAYRYTLVTMRKNNTSVIREGTLSGSVILFELGASETTTVGRVEASIQIYDADNKRISSAPIAYDVLKDFSLSGSLPADDKTLVIANEFQLITAINKSELAMDRVDILIQETPQPDEVVDIRVRNNGTVASTAGQYVRELDAQLAEIAKPVVSFTFDDGYAEDDLTYSILKEYGFAGSFGLITNQLYDSGKNSLYKYKQYEKDGFEVLSHSATHISLTSGVTPEDDKFREMQSSADKLRGLGFSANGFIVPFSNISTVNRNYAKNIYDYILIGGTGLNGKNDFKNKTLTRVSQYSSGVSTSKALIDQAITEKKLLIFYDHRIGQSGSLTEAEFRDILDYLQTKVTANLIEVHNIKNAVNKYYGVNVNNKSIVRSNDNLMSPLNSASWTFADNGTGATESIDTSYLEPVRKITIPANATVGSTFTVSNKYTLESFMETLGEKADLHVALKMSNSEYTFFNKYVIVDFMDVTENILFTKTNQIYPNNSIAELVKFELYNEVGIALSSVRKVKVTFKVDVVTSPTVPHDVRVMSAKLVFPNSNFAKTGKLDEGFSAKLMVAQTIPNGAHTTVLFDTVDYNDNLSYNPATGEFTAKQSGVYQINAHLKWASMVDNSRLILAAFVGSTQNKSSETLGKGTSAQGVQLSTHIKLSVGNKLTIRAYQASGGNLDLVVGNYTWATVNLMK